jgi:hypothetical protein
MWLRVFLAVVSVFLGGSHAVAAQEGPWVHLRITTGDGEIIDRTARAGTETSVTMRDGTIFELRPVIHNESLREVRVEIFKLSPTGAAGVSVAEVTAVEGGAAVEAKTRPRLTIAVPRITR